MSRQKPAAWTACLLWWLSIVAMGPLGRPVVTSLRSRGLLTITVTLASGAVVLAVAGALLWLRHQRRLNLRQSMAMLASMAVVLAASPAVARPEERWHVAQFVLLGALLRWASDGLQRYRLAVATLTVMLAGLLDEGMQLFLPNRVCDLEDVLLNGICGVVGVGIAQLAIFLGRQS